MKYLEKNLEKRQDVHNILNTAKTVIVTATKYSDLSINIDNPFQTEPYGKIARYACNADYHYILLDQLKVLSEKIIQLNPDAQNLCYIDTGPIMEKQWAIRAGIGWQGMNSLIINKELGSFILLGIIITSVEFPNDVSSKDYCGTCSKCIEVCPTQAIEKPKVINTNKCISSWTIESKPNVEIPDFIKENNPNLIFGCDLCQEVCPWNKKSKQEISRLFNPKYSNYIKVEDILNMTENEFRDKYSDTPISRLKLAGLKRNAESIISNNN